jgi:hypothetical protein
MTAPQSLSNNSGQSLDTLFDTTGAGSLKRAVGPVDNGSEIIANQGVATHKDQDTFATLDPVVLVAGFDRVSGLVSKLLVDLDGNLKVTPIDLSAVNTLVGAVDETPPAGDTDSSGLNGRMQRNAQQLTALLERVPIDLGANGGLKVESAVPSRTPTVFKPFSAIDITSEQTIWTPGYGMSFRLMGYVITQGVLAGDVALKDGDSGATILIIPANTINAAQVSPPLGDGILSASTDNNLRVLGSSTETISGYVFGTEE